MATVLLAHGLLGFSDLGALPYFNGVKKCWPRDPNGNQPEFLTPAVDPTGSFKSRAAELKKAIEGAFSPAELAAGKVVHIVAHSMGGLDARYLMSARGLDCAAWIASLTTISTPHRGTPIADIAIGKRILSVPELTHLIASLSATNLQSVLRSIQNPALPALPLALFAPEAILTGIGDLSEYLKKVLGNRPEALNELTTSFAAGFNSEHPIIPGIPLLSYAGVSRPDLTMCRALFASWMILQGIGGDNDGMVPVSSSIWGDNFRKVPADHLEEVGLADLVDGLPAIRHYDISKLYAEIDAWHGQVGP